MNTQTYRSHAAVRVVRDFSDNLLCLDVANDTFSKLSGRSGVLDGVGQMSSRDDKGTVADSIQDVAVDLGTARVNVSEGASLERVAESKSNL